ncbi:MAG: hypothetical protein QM808_00580 [Steroidobacteraceae bacterium]
MFNRILAAGALSVLLAGTALADYIQVATLASPVIKQDQLIDGTIWRCAETTCRSASQPADVGLPACRSVAKRFGQVAAYASGDKQLSAEQLETCNQVAKGK